MVRDGRALEVVHVVGAALLRTEPAHRCLVARRGPHVSSPGLWEFPGGKVEKGEDPRAALTRELREEMAIATRVDRFLGRGEVISEDRYLVLDVYVAYWVAGEIRLRDHDAARWLRASELTSLEWAAADVPVLDELRSLLTPRGL